MAGGGLDAVLAAVAEQVGEERREVAVRFARAMLRRIPDERLQHGDRERTAAQLVDAFRFADRREVDELAIRVFTPEIALDGSQDPGTVIQVSSADRPFLLSTVTEELDLHGVDVRWALHPILGVRRAPDGHLAEILPARDAEARDSFLHLELADELDAEAVETLATQLRRLLADVVAATRDFRAMRERVRSVADGLRRNPPAGVDPEVSVETAALLNWLLDENFVLLGVREYELVAGDGGDRAVAVRPGTGLGILADESTSHYAEPVGVADLPEDLRGRLLEPQLLTISHTNRLSTVHRRDRMDYVGIKWIAPDGAVRGEFRLVGLFTKKAFSEPAPTTPVLRRKLQEVLEREDVVAGSYDETTLVSLFQALPKDELFQTDLDTLHQLLVALFQAEEQRETRVMTRLDRFTRTVSVLVALPRDRYSPQLRRQLQALLREKFGGERVDVDLSLGDREDAIVRFAVHAISSELPAVTDQELEHQVRTLARSWTDELITALVQRHGERDGQRLMRQFGDRLPRAYRDVTTIDRALDDLELLDRVVGADLDLAVRLQPPSGHRRGLVRLSAVRRGAPVELSSFLPILESLGLTVAEEVPHTLSGEGPELNIHDFGVRAGIELEPETDGRRIAEATLAAWRAHVEVDSLNRLVLAAGLTWRQVSLLRAYRRYRLQVGTAYTPGYINDALTGHPEVTRALVALFEARFDPAAPADDDRLAELRQRVLDRCDEVERLDHDRILRSFLALIDATLRTSYYRRDAVADGRDGRQVPYLSLKLDSAAVPDAPRPVPFREIFVYSPDVEGIHLRGGPVARGGLRWSDRRDDVRTEVLGLMKAQMLKNAVIVPTGAKGGFVVKRPPAERQALREEVERQYVTFIRGLLDLTDNLVGGEVVPPTQVRRLDGDDPYLVVAADKGTATFSDLANRVAAEYDFWLGDAFASGGSKGYDHKELGITARGAWLAVRRHFRELGIDTQTEPVSVVGIGDMSGDVFGNGMLSSPTIRLLAAFDHRDIFIDPDPDPRASFDERQRLFTTPGTTWQDVDPATISEGGGVWSRDRKRIELNDRIRAALRIDDEVLSPAELIQAILRAPVDLLWAGGIGTYVKASGESNDAIGDRANDELRVDADTLRARVFGEGANLSITQPARIQYARRGGRINQDAIDNAGGVDISDHEVNVKILLRLALEEERIDESERDELLAAVTDDVVAHVLEDVDRQTWLLSQEVAASPAALDQYEALMQTLTEEGGLDREVEFLPDTEEVAERGAAGAGLTRPELATLVGYAKRRLASDLLSGEICDQAALQPTLRDYFPRLLVERFGDLLDAHRLRRELVAMIVANDLVNRLGVTFPFRLASETGHSRQRVVAAYWAAREVSGAAAAWEGIEQLADLLDPERQLAVKRDVDTAVEALVRTYLTDPSLDEIERVIERDRDVVAELRDELMSIGTPAQRQRRVERANRLMDDLVEPELATYLACAPELALGPDVAAVLRSLGPDTPHRASDVTDAFLRLDTALALDRLRRALQRLEPAGRWKRWQHGGLALDLRRLVRDAVAVTFADAPTLPGPEAVERFLEHRRPALEHALTLVREVDDEEEPELAAVAVAIRTVRNALETP